MFSEGRSSVEVVGVSGADARHIDNRRPIPRASREGVAAGGRVEAARVSWSGVLAGRQLNHQVPEIA